jgi:hypothetical protein
VVNKTVIHKTTIVNVKNITVYQNANVTNAVVAVRPDRFGRDHVSAARVTRVDAQDLAPVHGALDVKPVPASLVPATGASVRPPDAVQRRPVVATRAPREVAPTAGAEGLTEARASFSPPPGWCLRRLALTSRRAARPPFGKQSAPERFTAPSLRGRGPTRTGPSAARSVRLLSRASTPG